MRSTKNVLIIVVTLFLGGLGMALRWWFVSPSWQYLFQITWQAFVIGISLGIFFALVYSKIFSLKTFQPLWQKLKTLLCPIVRPFLMPLLLSLAAGIGEELLFRAFLQEVIGLVPAAFLFVLVHVHYWQMRPWRGLLFISLLLISIVLGILYHYWGIYAAMSFHTTYDAILLFYLRKACMSISDS